MSTSVLIDYNLRGWAADNPHIIKQAYQDVRYVGEPPNPPSNSLDHVVASYCIENGLDLLTFDKTAHVSWLNQETDEVRISVFSIGSQIVYRITTHSRAAG